MKYLKSILIICALYFASLSAFNIVHCKNDSGQSNNAKDSVKNDEFQVLIDDYCKAKSLKYMTDKEIDRLEGQIKSDENDISRRKSNIEKYKKSKEENIVKPKIDSTLIANDSLKNIFVKNDSLSNEKTDSLIKANEASISEIKKDNLITEKQIVSLKNKNTQQKFYLESKQKELKASASKVRGAFSFDLCGVKYNAYVAGLDSEEIRMHLFHKSDEKFYSLGAVREFLEHEKTEPRMITNAGMFTPTNEPVGLYIEGSKTFYEIDTSKRNTDENFFLYPNGVFYVDSNNIAHIETTDNYVKIQEEEKFTPKLATQSGPMLVINGKLHDKFTAGSRNEKIRSGVGIINEKKVIFAITLNESNFYEFASFFRDVFNCKNALFLDGAISQMYLKNKNQVSGGHFGPLISVSKKK